MKEYIIRTDAELRVENGRFTLVYDGSCVHTDMVKELPPHGDLGDTSELYVDILADLQTSKIQTLQDVLKILKVHFNNAPVILKANYKED